MRPVVVFRETKDIRQAFFPEIKNDKKQKNNDFQINKGHSHTRVPEI